MENQNGKCDMKRTTKIGGGNWINQCIPVMRIYYKLLMSGFKVQ